VSQVAQQFRQLTNAALRHRERPSQWWKRIGYHKQQGSVTPYGTLRELELRESVRNG